MRCCRLRPHVIGRSGRWPEAQERDLHAIGEQGFPNALNAMLHMTMDQEAYGWRYCFTVLSYRHSANFFEVTPCRRTAMTPHRTV